MTKIIALALTLLMILPAVAKEPKKKKRQRSAAPAVNVADVPLPTGRRLRDIAPADGSFPVLIGGSINAAYFGTPSEVILSREFGFTTPGNDFKQTAIAPEPGVVRFKKSDPWIERFETFDQIVRLHSAISPQCSKWAKSDDRTAEELAENLETYLTAVCERYQANPRIRWMDVVNETVTREGEWFGPREGNSKWENPWPLMGHHEDSEIKIPIYITRAFEIAGEKAPDLKLVYNQHGSMEPAMWRRVCAAVLELRGRGLRVDAIGWQAHVDTGFENEPGNMKRLHDLIRWCHQHDLEFHVTENTVWIKEGDNEAGQAETFRAILAAVIEHREEGVVSWNAWQMCDNETQRSELKGCLFDKDARPKPAYYAIQEELEKLAETIAANSPRS